MASAIATASPAGTSTSVIPTGFARVATTAVNALAEPLRHWPAHSVDDFGRDPSLVRALSPLAALRWDEVTLNRTNARWRELLNLARLLLGERFQTTSAGGSDGFPLLFEMNTLFEEYVARMLKRALADTLRRALATLPNLTLRDQGERRCAIVTFTVEGEPAPQVARRLAASRINVTHSTPFSARLDFERRRLAGVVRASIHYYNTEDEIDRFCRAVRNA